MKATDWDSIRHFKASENWGDVSKINFQLVKTLDLFRDYIATPIQITCGTQGKHIENSMHYLGKAVDVVFPSIKKADLFDLFLCALRFSFGGVGIYPDWHPMGGLHLDVRDAPFKAQWIGYNNGSGQIYLPMTKDNLKKSNCV